MFVGFEHQDSLKTDKRQDQKGERRRNSVWEFCNQHCKKGFENERNEVVIVKKKKHGNHLKGKENEL